MHRWASGSYQIPRHVGLDPAALAQALLSVHGCRAVAIEGVQVKDAFFGDLADIPPYCL